MSLLVPDVCYRCANTGKHLISLDEWIATLGHSTQMLLKHNWRKLENLRFLNGFAEYSCLVKWIEFFHMWVKYQTENFSYCIFTETFAIGFQNWFDHEWIDFGVFFTQRASSCCLICMYNVCKKCSFVFLFRRHRLFSIFSLSYFLLCSSNVPIIFRAHNCSIVLLFWRHHSFSIATLISFLVCSSNVPYLSAVGVFKIDWWALSMQLNFIYYVCASSGYFCM